MTLSILIWLPLFLSLLVTQLPGRLVGRYAALLSLIPLGIAVSFVARFNAGNPGLQFVTDHVWISALGIHYKLGINGLNISLVLLTTVLFTLSLAWSAARDVERPKLYYLYFGMAETAVLGAFVAQDLMLFVAFFDLMLIPFYFLVGSWGTGERVRATVKMVIYTMVGSFLMLAGAVATGVIASGDHNTGLNFTFSALRHLPLSRTDEDWIFLAFALAFLVKMPMAPFHGWMADAYKSMPIPAVAVFSGVVAKVASYGFLQIVLPLFPHAAHHYQLLMMLICVVSIMWGTAMAFTTNDSRMVIAYSSVAQMGFITLGIFSLDPQGGQGALLQMLNHGIVIAAGFFIVAALAARAGGSEDIRDMGGIAFRAPVLAGLFVVITFANLAMPGSSNFIGEFMILLGTFDSHMPIALITSVAVVGAGFYALRLFIRAMHNRVGGRVHSIEIQRREAVAIVPLCLIILALAFFPQFGLSKSETSMRVAVLPAAAADGGHVDMSQYAAGFPAYSPARPRRVYAYGKTSTHRRPVHS
ncbi:MAG TPA: NADH-quinone oxidoreductase subunit M [Solirubrobacteraceae bacterium]|nr:NADH-quinone oxidoreductase subunit M [Solirubrobacteraceae bacterium]